MSNLSDIATHTRASSATYVDADGVLQTAAINAPRVGHHLWNGTAWVDAGYFHESESRTNLFLDTANPETQTIPVTEGSTYTASFRAGTPVVDINETLAINAVDVFVYDTSKDSDGGTWRTGALAQASSWYNETLNTATRGSRREFPSVAVIVAEADKVTIYDGDDPTLPMWMVFPPYPNGFVNTTNSIKSVIALNGKLARADNRGTSVGYGVGVADFIADTMRLYTNSQNTNTVASVGVSGRGSWGFYGTGTSLSDYIVNAYVNDVAITVLSNAPIDPATGLPVPTIAVATAGGVSVIKDDGAVVDSASTGEFGSLDWQDDDLIAWSFSSRLIFAYSDWQSDSFANSTERYSATSDIQLFKNAAPARYAALAVKGDNHFSLGLLSETGADSGLFNVDRNNGQAHITSSYNTGWMNGDIKGAFLSSTDATSLVGSGELVTNGTFDTDVSGWTDYSAGSASVSWNASGYINLTGASDGRGQVYQAITTVVGAAYVLQVEVTDSTPYQIVVGTSAGGNQLYSGTDSTGNKTVTFTATTTTSYVALRSRQVAETVSLDNISVQLADADRSVNNNGLIVNGTVSRDPVSSGADLVAYSGFSTSNYLEQPYNSDLDFGTGDFCVMGWVKTTGTTQALLRREDVPNTGARFGLEVSPTGLGRFFCGTVLLQTSNTVNSGQWVFLAAVRSGGVGYIYSNGVLAGSATASDDLDNTSAILRLGGRVDGAAVAGASSVSLVRISGTAPTADQITKIYNDEKVLFQENAQATLYGASDAVTALAHDSDTDLLHVGTSAGRSVFSGLRRINNTTTGVTTAISATNSVIGEQ